MDIKSITSKASPFIKKYKFAILILLLGLVLISLPDIDTAKTEDVPHEPTEPEMSVSQQLEELLTQVEGAGNVKVMLTISYGEKICYQTDDSISTEESGNNVEKNTVIITDAQRNQSGLVLQKNPPKYMGAIIVCDGAQSPTVKLSIIEAVSKVTGLSTDKITVLKMK